jgi:hypothetical protein
MRPLYRTVSDAEKALRAKDARITKLEAALEWIAGTSDLIEEARAIAKRALAKEGE